MKKNIITFLAAAFTTISAMPALAADVDGKVSKCEGNMITVTVTDNAGWLKKGTSVKVNGATTGTVANISGSTVVVKSKRAADCKAGEEVTIVKSVKESQGC